MNTGLSRTTGVGRSVSPRSARRLRPSDILVLGVAATWTAVDILAHNLVGVPHAERLLVPALTLWVAGVGVAALLAGRGLDRGGVVFTTFLVLLGVTAGGMLDGVFHLLLLVVAIGLYALLTATAPFQTPVETIGRAGMVAVSIALITGSIIAGVRSLAGFGNEQVRPPPPIANSMVATPDIVLLVLDGYPGPRTLEMDFGDDVARARRSGFRESGFQFLESGFAAYHRTVASVPSLLNMGYPSGLVNDSAANTLALHRMSGGDNRIVEFLKAGGYSIEMVESGWSGGACTASVDLCHVSHPIDESAFLWLERSILGDWVLSRFGYTFTASSLHTFDILKRELDRATGDANPTFVFAHALIPHPPFFLDPSCRVVVDDSRAGVQFIRPHDDIEIREHMMLEQIECVDRLVQSLASRLAGDAVLVVVSDHGTDRRGQLVNDPASWTEKAVLERMHVLAAVRAPDGCEVADGFVLPNLMRRVLSCFTKTPLPEMGDRIFTSFERELDGDVVARLLNGD